MSADPGAIMEVLQRIQSMQEELLAKVEKIGSIPATPMTPVPAGKSEAWDYEISRTAKAPLFAHDIEEDTLRESRSAPTPQSSRTWLSEDLPGNGHLTTDMDALYSAMGWRKKVQQSFVAKPGADWLTRFAYGPVWAAMSVTIIVINTVIIGVEIQFSTCYHLEKALNREGNWETPGTWDDAAFGVMEKAFLAWMIVEVLVNAYAQKRDFWCGKDWTWNMFDLALIVLSLATLLLENTSVGFLRVVRLLRLGKILRAFRVVKFFRRIRTMVISISGSLLHLSSALLLMCIFMYMVALVMMQGLASETEVAGVLEGITDGTGANPRAMDMFSKLRDGDTLVQQVYILYGTIGRTIRTLLMTITGGIEWWDAAYPVAKVSWIYGVLWICYIVFMMFGMLNVLTGIFVDAAIQASEGDRDNMIQTQMEERHSFINMIREVFESSDTDNSGQVTMEEFNQLLKNSEMVSYLEAMGLDASEAAGLFRLLDDDGSGAVDINEFVTGFMRLKGSAKAVDMVMLLYENRKMSKRLHRIFMEARTTNCNIRDLKAEGRLAMEHGRQSKIIFQQL